LKVSVGETTLEMELTMRGTLAMFAAACEELGSPKTAAFLQKLDIDLKAETVAADDIPKKLAKAKKKVLNASLRFSKGRFAQVASKHASKAIELPDYIVQAVKWVTE
jgi:putative ATP-dependent endonuclease of OLD family